MGGKDKKDVCVVGGGLAGGLAAIYLARRGYNVEVFERRGDTRLETAYQGRSINLALSTRGMTALQEAGASQAMLDGAIAMPGRMLHAMDGTLTYQPYDKEGKAIYSVSRQKLNEVVITEAEKYPNVKVHFEQKADNVNVRNGVVTFENAQGNKRTLKDSIIIGADGTFSQVRRAMYTMPRFNYSQDYIPQMYKELCIPPSETGDYRIKPHNALHIWPRGAFMIIALPNQDKSYTLTLFLDQDSEGECFEKLKTDDDIMRFMKKYFADLVPHMPTVLQDFKNNPTSSLVTVRCSQYHVNDNVCLLGDAAHAVVPFYGQGCNCAFEDVRVLGGLLEDMGDDWSRVLPAYTKNRVRHCNAIADMALDNFVEMRSSVASRLFLLRKGFERMLHGLWPGFIPLYTMISFTNIPYDDAREKARRQDVWINRLTHFTATGIAVGMAGGAMMYLKNKRG